MSDTGLGTERAVEIKSGINKQTISINEGETLTIGDIRNRLGHDLNIAPTAIAAVNGEEVTTDDRVLVSGDSLEFIKRSGSKG